MGVGQHVGLGDERQPLFLITFPCQFEGVTQTAFDSRPCGDHELGGDLHVGILVGEASGADVEILCILPHNHEINVFRSLVLQGAVDSLVELHRAQVDVLLELEAELEQQPLLEDSRSDVRMPYGAEIDRIEAAQCFNRALGENLARLQVAFTAEIKFLGTVLKAVFLADRVKNLESLGDDFGAGSISPQDS